MLEALPERLEVDQITLVHGSPRDPVWEYITQTPEARANFGAFATPYCLHGHTHVPAFWRDDDGRVELVLPAAGSEVRLGERRLLLNPGSVGQPRDGDPRASWLEIDTGARRATWRRVAYPVDRVQADIRAAGLPSWLADRLAVGG
jgi:diadenosine tetraphosphatase ApaH/serine/threonine PP2A family protein phosphatase